MWGDYIIDIILVNMYYRILVIYKHSELKTRNEMDE